MTVEAVDDKKGPMRFRARVFDAARAPVQLTPNDLSWSLIDPRGRKLVPFPRDDGFQVVPRPRSEPGPGVENICLPSARVRACRAHDDREQARLDRAVASDQPDALTGLDHQVGMVEQRDVAVGEGELGELEGALRAWTRCEQMQFRIP